MKTKTINIPFNSTRKKSNLNEPTMQLSLQLSMSMVVTHRDLERQSTCNQRSKKNNNSQRKANKPESAQLKFENKNSQPKKNTTTTIQLIDLRFSLRERRSASTTRVASAINDASSCASLSIAVRRLATMSLCVSISNEM